ncbi:GspE/PulE family protein [Marinomonas ostreistagni]|uniref:GspE/PulE family protein n=1 Tax=Marinomonas ostreistagni TaxID=359209 RepID=UPI0019529237|nr:ATPase, T2SS/T4P/T4SS family [Marinomonas ostreistagni]MBM6550259.1 Flp pilus assembly complex ATPase component TadA [Marinomonas ostreistagni]
MNLDQLLQRAIEQQASDIHILLTKQNVIVRLRCFGQLTPPTVLEGGPTLVNRIKIEANLNIAETRRTQEGQFSVVHEQATYFVRVSIVHSEQGEKLALRILSPFRQRALTDIGLPTAAYQALETAIQQTSGLILVCGATGSGKTTTLYSCIEHINDGSRTIFTIEDPVELPIQNIYQFEPNIGLDIDTHSLLKAFMRQDPDVIMVGEIRDAKTADLAISAALTGHLVLATLHTNSALNVVHRCQNWSVDFFSLVSTLKLIIHQSMTYQTDSQHPLFSTLQPQWQNQLPSSYATLIEQPQLWQLLMESN